MLLCFVGPAGGGKTSHGEQLLKDNPGSLRFSISATSRQPRANEIADVHYHFLSREEFKRRIDAGLFFEWEEVHGNYYGTLKQTIEDAASNGIDLLLDIDIRGALSFKRNFPKETVAVFLVPPDTETLVARIKGRGAVSEQELATRLGTARKEYDTLLDTMESGPSIDYFVINDDRERAHRQLQAILAAERAKLQRIDREDLKQFCKAGLG